MWRHPDNPPQPCATPGCVYIVTEIGNTHCCRLCYAGLGTHGPLCACVLIQHPPAKEEEDEQQQPQISNDVVHSDDVGRLRDEIVQLREELRLERGWTNTDFKPHSATTWHEYAVLPFQRRDCVALRQIGTEHERLDVVLCALLGLPGVLFGLLLGDSSGIDCRLRVLIALESGIVATVSTLGDGLHQHVLWYDKHVTAPAHVAIWLVLLLYLTVVGRLALDAAFALLVLGAACLSIFHARAYFVVVRQDPVISRRWARAWHVAATLVPMSLVTLLAVT